MRPIPIDKDFVSEPVARALYEADLKFDTVYFWDAGFRVRGNTEYYNPDAYPAPTTGQLFMFLPAHLKSGYTLYLMKDHKGSYYASYRRKRGKTYRPEYPGHQPAKIKRRLTTHRASSPADALASLALWMKRSGWFDQGRWENDTP